MYIFQTNHQPTGLAVTPHDLCGLDKEKLTPNGGNAEAHGDA
jgi:hypothetical protein